MLRKALFSFAAIVAALSMALPTNAATTLNWTDLSSQLTVRTNRPVWAMAYANGNWFYTDGQDLWNGGQVYRYDGYTQTNITLDVRNAGINRVDDIVSDGSSVVFLKNVFRLDNQVEALRYRDGSYSNITTSIRAALDSNEGISSLVGRNGIWMMVSTRVRLVRFAEDFTSYTRLTLPSELRQLWSSDPALLYSAHHHIGRSDIVLAPVGNQFLLGANRPFLTADQSYGAPYRGAFWTINGSTFQKISMPADFIKGIAWNQGQALAVLGQQNAGSSPERIYRFDGYSWTQGPYIHGACSTDCSREIYLADNTTITWDGTQWLIVTGKNLYQATDNTIEFVGPVRDYFVTAASNGNGTTLFGGTVSDLNNSQPTNPLTAKLTKVTYGSVSTPTNNNSQTSGNISSWTWLDPNVSSIANNQTATFNVGAWGGNGLSRIDIVVNGVTRRSCTYATAYGNQNCNYTLYGGDYAVGTTASMNAMITGADGKTAWSPITNVYVTNANGSTNNPNPTSNTNTNASVWAWSTPEVSNIATNESASFNVGATDPDGISKIELYVNGSIWKTCNLGTAYNYQTCAVTVNGSSFTAGSDVFVNGKVTDIYGNATWTGSRTYRIVGASTSNNTSNQTANWIWSSPDVSSLSINQSATFNVGAWDADGLNRTEIWVNGQLKRTCDFGNIVGNRDCSFVINANNYQAGTNVFVNAMMVDAKGNTTWSASRSYAITSSTYGTTQAPNSPTNLPGSVLVTSNRDSGYTNNQYITYTASANDQNGIDRIELWVNGTLVKTCYNVSSCSWTGGYYNTRNYVNYGATIVDKAGFALWTGYKTIAKK